MRVRELVAKLQSEDQDALVVVQIPGYHGNNPIIPSSYIVRGNYISGSTVLYPVNTKATERIGVSAIIIEG